MQTVPPIQGGEFMQVGRNGDIVSNLVANFYRRFQDTEGLALFRCKASEVEQNTKAIEDNHRNPTSEGDKRTEALRVPKPDNPESKQGYRFDPAKIDLESQKKVGITADTLKNAKDSTTNRPSWTMCCTARSKIWIVIGLFVFLPCTWTTIKKIIIMNIRKITPVTCSKIFRVRILWAAPRFNFNMLYVLVYNKLLL